MKSHAITAIAIAVGAGLWAHTGFGDGKDKTSPDATEPEITLSSELRENKEIKLGITELRTVGESVDPVTAVPIGAIDENSDSDPVVYRKSAEGDDKFVAIKVELGASDETHVEIKSGLFPGDSIVTENASKVVTKSDTPTEIPTEEEPISEPKEAATDSADIPNPPTFRGLDSDIEENPEVAKADPKGGFNTEGTEKAETNKADKTCKHCGKPREGSILICPGGACVFPGEITIYRVPVPVEYFYVPDYEYVPCPPPVCPW